MGRVLRHAGIGMWAACVWLALAEVVGWLPSGASDPWFWRGLWAGAALVGIGLLLGAATPVRRELVRGRCVRCGTRIERGQTYCHDHLQAAVNEFRDRARPAVAGRSGRG